MFGDTEDECDALKTDQDADDPGDTPNPHELSKHIIAAHLTAFGVISTRNDIAYRMRRGSHPMIASILLPWGLRGL
jgi:hypothetical protein